AQEFGADRERGERRLELVRERRDEIGAGTLLVPNEGHVLEQDDRPQRLTAGAGPGQLAAQIGMVAPAYEYLEFGGRGGVGAVRGAGRHYSRDGRALLGEPFERASNRSPRFQIENRAGDLVDVHDRLRVVQD